MPTFAPIDISGLDYDPNDTDGIYRHCTVFEVAVLDGSIRALLDAKVKEFRTSADQTPTGLEYLNAVHNLIGDRQHITLEEICTIARQYA